MADQDIPMYRVIIAATIVFIVGLVVFTVIFRAYITFQELQTLLLQSGEYSEEETTIVVLGAIPWALGGFYVSLLGIIIYFLLRGNKPLKKEEPGSGFRGFSKY